MKKISIITLAAMLFLLIFPVMPFASDAKEAGAATEYTKTAEMISYDGYSTGRLTDDNESTKFTFEAGGTLTITAAGKIAGIYIKFYTEQAKWTATSGEASLPFGENGLLHEYADVKALNSESVIITFREFAALSEIRLFGEGKLPADVQVWQKPYEKPDIVLLSSHSDDEQLFFAGLIPHCAAKNIKLQVVYFCNHNDTPIRLHEQLNGMWAAGATHYPMIGKFPDLYSESLEGALNAFGQKGYKEDDFIRYQVEILRRFKPSVVVGHDVNGEYGHGTHRLNTDSLIKALKLAPDSAAYPDLAEKYGVWDVPKTYLHLWQENQLTMNYDVPLDYFGGKTAYQMSSAGYACHNSQQWTWFTAWMKGTAESPITAASQISKYSPCQFGLYRSTVGQDSGINDMLENIRREEPVTEPVTEPETEPETTAVNETTVGQNSDTEPNNSATPVAIAVIIAFFAALAICIVLIFKK